jgi:hypothetical protein
MPHSQRATAFQIKHVRIGLAIQTLDYGWRRDNIRP